MKGKTNNPGGRPAGTPNKVTTTLRQQINNFLNENWEQVRNDFKELEPKERLQFYERLLSYSLPKPAPEQPQQAPEQRSIASIFETVMAKIEASQEKTIHLNSTNNIPLKQTK